MRNLCRDADIKSLLFWTTRAEARMQAMLGVGDRQSHQSGGAQTMQGLPQGPAAGRVLCRSWQVDIEMQDLLEERAEVLQRYQRKNRPRALPRYDGTNRSRGQVQRVGEGGGCSRQVASASERTFRISVDRGAQIDDVRCHAAVRQRRRKRRPYSSSARMQHPRVSQTHRRAMAGRYDMGQSGGRTRKVADRPHHAAGIVRLDESRAATDRVSLRQSAAAMAFRQREKIRQDARRHSWPSFETCKIT